MKKILALLVVLTCVLAAGRAFASGGDEMAEKKGILIVSFGTSMPEARKAIDTLVDAARTAYPEMEVRVAYTSNIIRRKILKEQGLDIPTPTKALAQMNDERFTHVYVQPTHIIPGEEYEDLESVVEGFAGMRGKYGFEHIALGKPLLTNAEDCNIMAGILARRFAAEKGKTIVLMGHGTPEHMAHALYSQLQIALDKARFGRFAVGTVEITPVFEDVLARVKKTGSRRVLLAPFMIVAGDHANNDLADPEDPESWFSRFKKAGYTVETSLVGIGEYPEIVKLFTENLKALIRE